MSNESDIPVDNEGDRARLPDDMYSESRGGLPSQQALLVDGTDGNKSFVLNSRTLNELHDNDNKILLLLKSAANGRHTEAHPGQQISARKRKCRRDSRIDLTEFASVAMRMWIEKNGRRCTGQHHRDHHDPPHEEHDDGVACGPIHNHRGTKRRRDFPRRHGGNAHAGTSPHQYPPPRQSCDDDEAANDDEPFSVEHHLDRSHGCSHRAMLDDTAVVQVQACKLSVAVLQFQLDLAMGGA